MVLTWTGTHFWSGASHFLSVTLGSDVLKGGKWIRPLVPPKLFVGWILVWSMKFT